jgi:hypothetical protein
MAESATLRFLRLLKILICLGMVSILIYFLNLVFNPKPEATHRQIVLSNGGIINMTWTKPRDDDVYSDVSYKPPGSDKCESVSVGSFGGPWDVSASYVVGELVVLIYDEAGGVPYVRTREGVWKTFGMNLWFPNTNDFSAEDIKLMGITNQISLAPRLQRTVSTEIENFDPQTRIFVITYQDALMHILKRLRLQLSEDGSKLKVLDMHDEKISTP